MADPFANGTTTGDVFATLLAEEADVPEPTVRQVLTTLWGSGDLDTIAIDVTVRYALDVTYTPDRRDGWPTAERVELPADVDDASARYNAETLRAMDYVDTVTVTHRATVTVTGPWKEAR